LAPPDVTRAWADPDIARAGAVMPATGSAPDPAVTVPGVMVRLETGMVRAVVSTVPAALVGTVAVTDNVHAWPVPRESEMLHGDEDVPVAALSVPSSVTPLRFAPDVVEVRDPPEMVESTVSAVAAGRTVVSRIPAAARTPAALMNLRMGFLSKGCGHAKSTAAMWHDEVIEIRKTVQGEGPTG